jgi:tetratricopeptide (TPR) repeat protein
MKRLNIKAILFVCVLIVLFIAGCAKEQQPRLESAEAYTNRGNAYDNKGQYDKAIADFNRALEISPKFAMAYNNRGNAYDSKGQYDKAISDFNKALELNPKYADAYYNRAIAYYFKKEYDNAWDDVNKAQDLGDKIIPKFLTMLREASGRDK